jgi:hypothetical protein
MILTDCFHVLQFPSNPFPPLSVSFSLSPSKAEIYLLQSDVAQRTREEKEERLSSSEAAKIGVD